MALMGSWVGFYTLLQNKFALNNFLELSAQIDANAFRILPTIAVAIAKQQTFDLSRLSNVKYIMCSGAVLPPPIIEFFHKNLPGAPIFQGYGMTETNITMLKPESAHRVGSVGKLFANIEARIVDDDGRDVGEGEQGEMLVRGPSIFRRYMRNEEATRETFDGAWMKTGDVVRVDKDGYWWLTERKKELIKYKGQVHSCQGKTTLNVFQQSSATSRARITPKLPSARQRRSSLCPLGRRPGNGGPHRLCLAHSRSEAVAARTEGDHRQHSRARRLKSRTVQEAARRS